MEITRFSVNLKENSTSVAVQVPVTTPIGDDMTELNVSIPGAKEWTFAELAARCAQIIGEQKAQRAAATAKVAVTLPAVDATAVAAAAAAAAATATPAA